MNVTQSHPLSVPKSSSDAQRELLRFEDVHFAYGAGLPVLHGASFAVREGELFGILGPNGSGKSTLLRLATRMLSPTRGAVTLEGRDVHAWPRQAFARTAAVLSQDTPSELPYRVLDIVLMGRTPHLGFLGFPAARDVDIAHAALAATGCAELAGRRLNELSGGERQRVFFAKALAQVPRLLLLDEPTAHLDLHHQIALHDLLRRRNREGLTVVAVLHDLNLAAQYCDRLALIAGGRVVACGTVPEVLTYRNVREVFDVEPYVGVNEVNGTRFLVPMSREARRETAPAESAAATETEATD